MHDKLRSAIAGGILIGLLAAIPFINAACCLWVLLGGALATYLYIKKSTVPVLMAEGVQLGALAGIIGGLLYLLVGVPVNILAGDPLVGLMIRIAQKYNPDQVELARSRVEALHGKPFIEQYLLALPGALLRSVFIVIFATLSGLLAVPIFEKRKGGSEGPPPPPTSFPPPPPVIGTQPGAGYNAEGPGGSYGSGD
ncbi:MAG TPA: hypothetical protein VGO91_15360 [Pyrinomonadaceae bacterium]|jgi:hypothetical protein|nr:hypothetical protein [Pyrinomonadaceae bacterium]